MSASEIQRLVDQAAGGDDDAWRRLMAQHRARLRRMIAYRMDRRLQGRVDPSDILQEAYVDATRRLPDYASAPTMPFFLWLRFLAGQRLFEQHRRHLGTRGRDARRDISLHNHRFPDTSSADLAFHLLSSASSPSGQAARVEQVLLVQQALETLEPIDREVLMLRHFEQLTNGEAAEVLGLDKSAASKRYARALIRVKDVLLTLAGGLEDIL